MYILLHRAFDYTVFYYQLLKTTNALAVLLAEIQTAVLLPQS